MSALNSNPFLDTILKAAQQSRVNGAFEQFLTTYINLSSSVRSQASVSQQHLREFLKEESDRDETFPPVLRYSDSDFIAGSFGRHTKIWPLDDVDIFFPLDGVGLIYSRGGLPTGDTVVSDGGLQFNPLLGARWAINNYVSSDLLVLEFTKALKRHYSQSDVSIDGEATTVQLTMGASGESRGLNFDVVPCFCLSAAVAGEKFYLIPDGRNGWKNTNPRNDEAVCSRLQAFHHGQYRKIVKLLKYWNAEKIGNALTSYYIELALANYFSSLLVLGQRISSLSQGVMLAFAALRSARLKGSIASPVQNAPAIGLAPLTAAQDLALIEACAFSARAIANERSGNDEQAIVAWKNVFGIGFAE